MILRADRTLLLEIGTEEIPARMIDGALRDLRQGLLRELADGMLLQEGGPAADAQSEVFGTPRRLAVRIRNVRERQPDREEEVTGPPVRAAFTPRNGSLTRQHSSCTATSPRCRKGSDTFLTASTAPARCFQGWPNPTSR